jgi:hypothetical protein
MVLHNYSEKNISTKIPGGLLEIFELPLLGESLLLPTLASRNKNLEITEAKNRQS